MENRDFTARTTSAHPLDAFDLDFQPGAINSPGAENAGATAKMFASFPTECYTACCPRPQTEYNSTCNRSCSYTCPTAPAWPNCGPRRPA